MTNLYSTGADVRVSVAFTDINNQPGDPTTITLRVRDPLGNITVSVFAASNIVKDSTGNYHFDVTLPLTSAAAAGAWYYRWEGTGSVTATSEGEFLVQPSKIV